MNKRIKKIIDACKLPIILLTIISIIAPFFVALAGLEIIPLAISVAVLGFAGYKATNKYELNIGASGAVGFFTSIAASLIVSFVFYALALLSGFHVPEDKTPFSLVVIISIIYGSAANIIPALIGGFIGERKKK